MWGRFLANAEKNFIGLDVCVYIYFKTLINLYKVYYKCNGNNLIDSLIQASPDFFKKKR